MLPSAIYSCTTFCAVLILMYISQKHRINQLSGLAKECPPWDWVVVGSISGQVKPKTWRNVTHCLPAWHPVFGVGIGLGESPRDSQAWYHCCSPLPQGDGSIMEDKFHIFRDVTICGTSTLTFNPTKLQILQFVFRCAKVLWDVWCGVSRLVGLGERGRDNGLVKRCFLQHITLVLRSDVTEEREKERASVNSRCIIHNSGAGITRC